MSEHEIGLFVQSKSNWICKHISKFKEKEAEKLNTEEIAFLRKQTAELVHKRVAYFAANIGVSYNRVSVRVQRSEIDGAIYEARSMDVFIDHRSEVEVIGFENFTVLVKKIN